MSLIQQVNLGDVALVKTKDHKYDYRSLVEGVVVLISHKGINITTSYGDRFVKWRNVLKITKNT